MMLVDTHNSTNWEFEAGGLQQEVKANLIAMSSRLLSTHKQKHHHISSSDRKSQPYSTFCFASQFSYHFFFFILMTFKKKSASPVNVGKTPVVFPHVIPHVGFPGGLSSPTNSEVGFGK